MALPFVEIKESWNDGGIRAFYWAVLNDSIVLTFVGADGKVGAMTALAFDETLHDSASDEFTLKSSNFVMRFVYAFFAFIRQEIVTTSLEDPTRTQRKRAAVSMAQTPIVRVIHLRRKTVTPSVAGEGGREYHCRWTVRPHWRNQWYATRSEHFPKFIPGYVKGPDDKPLKTPAIPIFAVIR